MNRLRGQPADRKLGGMAISPPHTTAHGSRRDPLMTYLPKSFSAPSRWRFGRNRRDCYLAQIPGPPTAWQATTILSLIALEWGALFAEDQGGLNGAREGREHRRLFQRFWLISSGRLRPRRRRRRRAFTMSWPR